MPNTNPEILRLLAMSEPTATEEQNHLWVDDGGGQRNITAEVAEVIGQQLDVAESVSSIDEQALADRILSIPYIRDAIELKKRTVVVKDELT